MQREGEDRIVALKNLGGSVALVHIQIDDGDFQRLFVLTKPLGLHQACRHCRVVEDTKATALVGIGVMRAARQIGRQALALEQRCSGSQHTRPDRAARALHHLGRPRKTNLFLLRCAQAALRYRLDVVRCVNQRQLAVAGGLRHMQLNVRHLLQQSVAQPAVFGHGEAVSRRQRQDKLVGIKSAHRWILESHL